MCAASGRGEALVMGRTQALKCPHGRLRFSFQAPEGCQILNIIIRPNWFLL